MVANPKISFTLEEATKLVVRALEETYEAWLTKQRKDTEDERFINKVMEDNHKTAIEYIKGMLLG